MILYDCFKTHFRVGLLDLLLFSLHNIRESSVAGLVNTEIDGENGRSLERVGFETAVDFALNCGRVTFMVQLNGEI